jgi:molybdopterin synthase catalytic subunit
MTVRIRLFAWLRERAGLEVVMLALGYGARAADAKESLSARYPSLRAQLAHVRPAINQQYASWHDSLHDGDELALIPPVSGG